MNLLLIENIPPHVIDHILTQYHDFSFTKTDSKRVLGSMNDLALHYKYSISYENGYEHCDVTEVIKSNNRIPFKALGYAHPIERLQQVMAQANLKPI